MKPFRDEVVISTKFGISFSEYTHGDIIPDARPEKIHQSVEGSLKRLQTETIDLYFQHRIDPKVEPEVVAEVMGELIKEGKIRHWVYPWRRKITFAAPTRSHRSVRFRTAIP